MYFSVRTSGSYKPCRKLIQICFPNRNCSCIQRTPNCLCSLFWQIGIPRIPCGRLHSGKINIIFNGKWNSPERTCFSWFRSQSADIRTDLFHRHQMDPHMLLFFCLCTRKARLNDCLRRQHTRAVGFPKPFDRQFFRQIHRFPPN